MCSLTLANTVGHHFFKLFLKDYYLDLASHFTNIKRMKTLMFIVSFFCILSVTLCKNIKII